MALCRNLFTNNIFRNSVKSCVFNSLRRNPVARKRFYRKCSILEAGSGYWEVTLDQRRVKTPAGQVLRVENQSLALALSNEWDAQSDTIHMSTMHLHGLCCTAIDNPNKLTKLDIADSIITYLETDTVLFLSEEPEDLKNLQIQEWVPIIEWFCNKMGVDIRPTDSISLPMITDDTKDILKRYLMSYNFTALHGFSFAVEALKSIILAVACMHRHIPVEKAVLLSRLEEDYQCGRWGRVEWAHDMAQQDLQSRVAAATLLTHLSSMSDNTKTK